MGFQCRRFKEPWTELAELMIQEYLVDDLLVERAAAIGLIDEEKLVAVLVWSQVGNPAEWESNVLATASGHTRRGHAERLKRVLLDLAADIGVESIRSVVHVDNAPMIQLNRKLGAEFARDPTDRRYLMCRIVVPGS